MLYYINTYHNHDLGNGDEYSCKNVIDPQFLCQININRIHGWQAQRTLTGDYRILINQKMIIL
jgi:hypothetical protein